MECWECFWTVWLCLNLRPSFVPEYWDASLYNGSRPSFSCNFGETMFSCPSSSVICFLVLPVVYPTPRALKLTVCVDISPLQIKGFVPKGNKNTCFNILKLIMCYYDFPELKPQKMETHIILFPSSKRDLVTRVCSFCSFSRVFKQLLLHYIQDISIIAVFCRGGEREDLLTFLFLLLLLLTWSHVLQELQSLDQQFHHLFFSMWKWFYLKHKYT